MDDIWMCDVYGHVFKDNACALCKIQSKDGVLPVNDIWMCDVYGHVFKDNEDNACTLCKVLRKDENR